MAEKRKYQRLNIALSLSCQKVGTSAEQLCIGQTLNASPGGLFFVTSADVFKKGDLLNVNLSVPPTQGLLETGGRISRFAKVLRVTPSDEPGSKKPRKSSSGQHHIALQFCKSPTLGN